jgi:hypothetical protein
MVEPMDKAKENSSFFWLKMSSSRPSVQQAVL